MLPTGSSRSQRRAAALLAASCLALALSGAASTGAAPRDRAHASNTFNQGKAAGGKAGRKALAEANPWWTAPPPAPPPVYPTLDMSGRLQYFNPPNNGTWIGVAIDYTAWNYNLTSYIDTMGFNPGARRGQRAAWAAVGIAPCHERKSPNLPRSRPVSPPPPRSCLEHLRGAAHDSTGEGQADSADAVHRQVQGHRNHNCRAHAGAGRAACPALASQASAAPQAAAATARHIRGCASWNLGRQRQPASLQRSARLRRPICRAGPRPRQSERLVHPGAGQADQALRGLPQPQDNHSFRPRDEWRLVRRLVPQPVPAGAAVRQAAAAAGA